MSPENPVQNKINYQNRRKGEQRKIFRRGEDRARDQALNERVRKFQSLLELGHLIGLDLQLNEMLLKIAQKACEVMEADRCSLFLHDPKTDELWSTVALGMGEQVIRIPSGVGVAGYCFQTGEIINLEDAYTYPRFNKDVDAQTGYHSRSLLCVPMHNRAGLRSGVIQLLNKKEGVFTKEDETFLETFGNHASVFIEMAQLQRARIDALEHSRKELEQLNRAKSKALDHLSHELRTPLAVIKGNIWILKRKLQMQTSSPPVVGEKFFGTMEKHLNRLLDIHQETDKIIRSYQELEERFPLHETDRQTPASFEPILLFPFAERALEKVKQHTAHRDIHTHLEGAKDLGVLIDPKILEDILQSLLKNAIENTPDEGLIRILIGQKDGRSLLKVEDFGIGITDENQKYLFDGLFHTQDTELYTSKKPYDFGAGGKGLDLLLIKTYGQRFGFDISAGSQRCTYLPTDRDLCPGKISSCPRCKMPKDCLNSGGSTFCLSFLT
jgi:signal transduction histidine kinase